MVKTCFGNLLTVDGVSILNNSYLLGSYFTDNSNSKTWTWEWLTEYQLFWNSKLQARFTDLVLEQVT